MTKTRIHQLIGIKGCLLLVFYDCHGYQFRVVSQKGEVFGMLSHYYLAEAAEREGRAWIKNSGGFD